MIKYTKISIEEYMAKTFGGSIIEHQMWLNQWKIEANNLRNKK